MLKAASLLYIKPSPVAVHLRLADRTLPVRVNAVIAQLHAQVTVHTAHLMPALAGERGCTQLIALIAH